MLGERISLLRRGRGWSQAELAHRLKISTSAVGMYEQGRREPSLSGLVTLSRVLEVSADYLLTGTPLTVGDRSAMGQALRQCLPGPKKGCGGFSEEELTVLYAAMLTESM